jgi:hypothetical protein
MMPAEAKTTKNLKFCPTICSLWKVSSSTKMIDAIDVPWIDASRPGRKPYRSFPARSA